MAEIVKPKILEPDSSRGFEPILHERTGVGPMPKDSAIRHGRDLIIQGTQGDAVERDFLGIPFDPTGGWGQTEPIAVLPFLNPRSFNSEDLSLP